MNVACVELAHHLGVPAAVPGLATDAKYAGLQAGYEKALKGLATAGVGADVLSGGVGMIDSVNTLFLPQIVLDAEVVGMIRRILGDVDTEPRGDDGRHDRARRHRRRLPQGEGDRAGGCGRASTSRPRSRRARPTTSGSPTGATRWPGPGSAWTRSSRRGPSAGRPLDDEQRAELARVCGVTPEMARALGD